MKMKDKTKQICKAIYGVIFMLFVIPSILAFISVTGFWVLYLSLTHPILAEYQNNHNFLVGLLNVGFGIFFVQMIIVIKSVNYIFGKEKESKG